MGLCHHSRQCRADLEEAGAKHILIFLQGSKRRAFRNEDPFQLITFTHKKNAIGFQTFGGGGSVIGRDALKGIFSNG